MKRFFLILLSCFCLMPSCSRTPESIVYCVWGIPVCLKDHYVEQFRDHQLPNGDVETEIKMRVDLSEKDIEKLIQKGAQPLPIPDSIQDKDWIEEKSEMSELEHGVFYYEPGRMAPHECKILVYDKDSQMLYYYLSIM